MKNFKDQKTQKIEEVSEEDQKVIHESQYYQEYMKKLSSCQPSKQELIKNILDHDDFRYQSIFRKKLIKHITFKSNISLSLNLQLGNFQTSINLVFFNCPSSEFPRYVIDSGAFSTVHEIYYENKNYAAKSISIQNRSKISEKINTIFEEYFFYKIAQILEVGPEICKIYGYDILCFQDRIEFVMEYCPNVSQKEKLSSLQSDLYMGLQKLHLLGIIHSDVKGENIGWSSRFQKWVFLDFGFAYFNKDKLGTLTQIGFRGTYSYCCKEMKNLYFLKKADYVDVYYNDLYGLERSFEEKKQIVILKKNQINKMDKKFLSFIDFLLLAYKFDINDEVEMEKMVRESNSMKYIFYHIYWENKKLDFIEITKNMEEFYKIHILNQVNFDIQEQQIKNLVQNYKSNKLSPFIFDKLIFLENNSVESIDKKIKKFWGKQQFMERIFALIMNTYKNEQYNKKKYLICQRITHIFNSSQKWQNRTNLWFYRCSLIQFEKYFAQNQQVVFLKQISNEFFCIQDEYSQYKTQMKIKNFMGSKYSLINVALQFVKIVRSDGKKNDFDQIQSKINELEIEENDTEYQKQKKFLLTVVQIWNTQNSIQKKAQFIKKQLIQMKNHQSQNDHFFKILQWIFKSIIKTDSILQYFNQDEKFVENNNLRFLMIRGNFKKISQQIKHLQIQTFFHVQIEMIRGNMGKAEQICLDLFQIWKIHQQVYSNQITRIFYLWARFGLVNKTIQFIELFQNNFISYSLQALHPLKIHLYCNLFVRVIFIFINFRGQFHEYFQNLNQKILTPLISNLESQILTQKQRKSLELLSIISCLRKEKLKAIKRLTQVEDQNENYLVVLCIFALTSQTFKHVSLIEHFFYKKWIQAKKTNSFEEYALTSQAFSITIEVLLKKKMILEVYKAFRKFDTFLVKKQFCALNSVLIQIFDNVSGTIDNNSIVQILNSILRVENLQSMKTSGQISAFIFFLAYRIFQFLEEKDRRRLLILVMIGLPNVQFQVRKKIEGLMISKYHEVQPNKSRRKKRILLRKEAFLLVTYKKWMKFMNKKAERIGIEKYLGPKLQRIMRNEKPKYARINNK